jgi:subtilisin family serine protease
MKKSLLLVLFALTIQLTYSQQKKDPRNAKFDFVPGKIIVKLKDDVNTKTSYNAKGQGTAKVNVGELLGITSKVASTKVMFTEKIILKSIARKQQKIYDYKIKNPITLKNIFLVDLKSKTENIHELIDELSKNDLVEYAEPNYNFSVNDFTIDSEIIYPKKNATNNPVTPNDPLYSQQPGIATVKIDKVWDTYGTGDGSQTIAILDTGVDYTHPDLEANIWINEAELNGVEGFDDDGNGFIDDVKGWDFINVDNEPLDDNMHGTHVAGIAGAVGGNGIGITGAAWNVKLMPVKVFQASGVGDAATIAEGVTYASENGANIINMSFGSYAQSGTLQAALEIAYSTSILVAAAGNDRVPIGPCIGCAPFFPAAYSYVLGVEDTQKPLLPELPGFTNFDQDGPVFSLYPAQLLNYELTAPGAGIISTVPNGGYRKLSGTSMSAPLVAGGLALYKQQKPDESQELLFGNLIKTASTQHVFVPGKIDKIVPSNMNFESAITIEPKPEIKLITAIIDDQFGDNVYQDDEPDAGETIHIYPTIKNYWGASDGVKIKLEFGGNEFQNNYYSSLVTINKDTTQTGSISAYAVYEQNQDPLIFSINNDVAHNVEIEFKLTAWDENYPELEKNSLKFKVKIKSAIKLQGLIEKDTVLTADKEYLIDNVLIFRGANLFIKPGVTITFGKNEVTGTEGRIDLYGVTIEESNSSNNYNGVYRNSRIYALGTKDSLITFKTDSYTYQAKLSPRVLQGGGENYNEANELEEMESISYQTNPIEIPKFTKKINDRIYQNGEYVNTVRYEENTPLDYSVFHYCYFDDGMQVASMYISNSQFPFARQSTFNSTLNHWIGDTPFLYKSNLDYRYYTKSYRGYNQGFEANFYNTYYSNFANLNLSEQYGNDNQTNPTTRMTSSFNLNNVFNMSASIQNYIDTPGYDSGLTTPIGFGASGFQEFEGFWSGAGTLVKIKELNVDSFNGGEGVWEYNNEQVLKPYEEAHGIVWKVLVNGFNSYDNSKDLNSHPIGVGTHEIKVFFNREMDKTVPPRISYGVRMPFTQTNVKDINEGGRWSDDGKIYTVNHEVKIGAADGINRIRVQDAQDLDGFKIPVDATRFNMLIQSAGSASTGFAAEPGLGKITLDWEAPEEGLLDDILGYNMYRYEVLTDTTFTEIKKINESLITDINFKDFEVEEGQQYFYKYKILRTSLEETDFSKTVTTVPLTSKLGDANGDNGVDVMDLVQNVDYILGNNPQPFIFKAADVNNDEAINVLDIVGIVDVILNPTAGKVATKGANSIDYYSNTPIGDATFYWEGNDLYVESEYAITGVQLAFPKELSYTVASNLPNFEWLHYEQDSQQIAMMYSFGNTQISAGKTKLLTKNSEYEADFNVEKAVVGTTNGLQLNAVFENKSVLGIDAPEQGAVSKIFTMGPNPTKGILNVNYYLPEQMDKVRMSAYDLQGKTVWTKDTFKNTSGQSNTSIDISSLNNGIYILVIDVIRSNQLEAREVNRIIVNK